MTTASRLVATALAAIVLTVLSPTASHAGHFTLAFQRQLPAWENSAGEGCIGGHVVRVWVWDENGNPMSIIDLKTTWDVLMGATDSDWHRIMLVWNGLHRTLYADGVEVAKDLTAQTDLTSATGGLYFGASNTLASTTFFDGLIDDIRIYNRALAPEEAAALSD